MKKATVVRTIVMAGALGVMPMTGAAQEPRPRFAQIPPGTAQPQPRASAAVSRPQGFNVVLVLGDLASGPHVTDDLPAAARKALTDMQDFLPYKNYRLLDSAWILSANDSMTSTSRLRGLDEREYELTLGAMPESVGAGSNGPLRVSFLLREPAGSREAVTSPSATPSVDHLRDDLARQIERRATAERESRSPGQIAELEKQVAVLESDLRAARERYGEWHPSILVRKAELDRMIGQIATVRAQALNAERVEMNRRALEQIKTRTELEGTRVIRLEPGREPRRIIIDTGFTMDVGETVVVGTSRVGGDKAILALLTAVPRNTKK